MNFPTVIQSMNFFKFYNIFKFAINNISDAYTTNDIEYIWKTPDPIQKKKGLEQSLPSFELQNINTSYCTSTTNTGPLK